MTGKKKEEKKVTETKEDKISLIVFKETKNIDNMAYAGFKASLEAEDGTEYTSRELENKYKEYQAKKAFIKKG